LQSANRYSSSQSASPSSKKYGSSWYNAGLIICHGIMFCHGIMWDLLLPRLLKIKSISGRLSQNESHLKTRLSFQSFSQVRIIHMKTDHFHNHDCQGFFILSLPQLQLVKPLKSAVPPCQIFRRPPSGSLRARKSRKWHCCHRLWLHGNSDLDGGCVGSHCRVHNFCLSTSVRLVRRVTDPTGL
jgi:hypothetical protein